jgi:hypothetical protein
MKEIIPVLLRLRFTKSDTNEVHNQHLIVKVNNQLFKNFKLISNREIEWLITPHKSLILILKSSDSKTDFEERSTEQRKVTRALQKKCTQEKTVC